MFEKKRALFARPLAAVVYGVRVHSLTGVYPPSARPLSPGSVDVIVRAEAVESAQAGDRCDLIGTLIVVPDVAALATPGARAETGAKVRGQSSGGKFWCGDVGVATKFFFLANIVMLDSSITEIIALLLRRCPIIRGHLKLVCLE